MNECGVLDHLWVVIISIQLKTSSLKRSVTLIKHLHLIFLNELNNILSPINHHYIFRFYADRVDTFKQMNVEATNLQIEQG